MAKLLESVQEYLHPAFIAEAAERLKEKEEPVAKTLFAWCAAILAGLLDWVGHEKAMANIFDGLDHFPPNVTQHPKDLLREGNLAHDDPKDISGHLLGQLFGAKTPALIERIAAYSGASPDHVSYLLGVSGPIVLSLLGHRVQAGALTISGLSNLLSANRDHIMTQIPPEVLATLALHAPKTEATAAEEAPLEEATGFTWVLPLLLLLGLGGLILLYLRYSA